MSLHVQALQKALGPKPAGIEARIGLVSYVCQIWRVKPSIGIYYQLCGAMMTHPTDGPYFHVASELSFLVGIYRMRLHLEGIHDYYSGT